VYSTEKLLKDNAEKIDEADKKKLEDGIASMKKTLEENPQADALKTQIEAFQKEVFEISAKLYQANPQGAPEQGESTGEASKQAGDDKVVDADFSEVKDEPK
jgi:molecular chaperone DnaK